MALPGQAREPIGAMHHPADRQRCSGPQDRAEIVGVFEIIYEQQARGLVLRSDQVIEVNLTSQFIITREFGRDMLERGSGKVIFTASLLSFQGGIMVPGYAASKSGVARLV